MFSAASSYSFIPPLFRLYYNTSLHHYLSTFLYVRKYHYFRKLLFYIRPAKMGSAQAKTIFSAQRYWRLLITYFKALEKNQ